MSTQRRVIQYTKEGTPVRSYDSIREAQAYANVTHVSSVCRRRRKSDGGYIWRYEGEPVWTPEPAKVVPPNSSLTGYCPESMLE